MLKQKSKGKSPLLDGGKPKLEEVVVAPVDDLVAQMAEANAQAVREINRREPDYNRRPDRCRAGCACDPCRDGFCGECAVDRARSHGEREYLERRYRDPYNSPDRDRFDDRRGIGYRLPTWAVAEWERYGTGWNRDGNPILYGPREEEMFRSFLSQVEYRSREREIEMERRRYDVARFVLSDDPNQIMRFLPPDKKDS